MREHKQFGTDASQFFRQSGIAKVKNASGVDRAVSPETPDDGVPTSFAYYRPMRRAFIFPNTFRAAEIIS